MQTRVVHPAAARPLAPRAWYARFTQTLVTALAAPTAEGRLYEVDMRLRPSGRQGPVAVSTAAFRDYQMAEAWTWEHLALTRARPVALIGAHEAMPRGANWPRRGRPPVVVAVGAPLRARGNENTTAFNERIESAVRALYAANRYRIQD